MATGSRSVDPPASTSSSFEAPLRGFSRRGAPAGLTAGRTSISQGAAARARSPARPIRCARPPHRQGFRCSPKPPLAIRIFRAAHRRPRPASHRDRRLVTPPEGSTWQRSRRSNRPTGGTSPDHDRPQFRAAAQWPPVSPQRVRRLWQRQPCESPLGRRNRRVRLFPRASCCEHCREDRGDKNQRKTDRPRSGSI